MYSDSGSEPLGSKVGVRGGIDGSIVEVEVLMVSKRRDDGDDIGI